LLTRFQFRIAALLAIAPLLARADVYESAFFSAQISSMTGSLAALGLSDADAISGKFVFDLSDIPATGSGIESVPFSKFPDIGSIPPSLAFQLSFGTVEVNLSDLVPNSGAILYDNGQFAGFDAQFDFTANGQQYLFQETGNSWDIELVENRQLTGDVVASGTFNIGPDSLFDILPLNLGALTGQNGSGSPSSGSGNPQPPGSDPPGTGPPAVSDPPSVPEPRMQWVPLAILAALIFANHFHLGHTPGGLEKRIVDK
jgi:hypothetical protein